MSPACFIGGSSNYYPNHLQSYLGGEWDTKRVAPTYNISTCGQASGPNGPTQKNCTDMYNGTGVNVKVQKDTAKVDSTKWTPPIGAQLWMPPITTEYRYEENF